MGRRGTSLTLNSRKPQILAPVLKHYEQNQLAVRHSTSLHRTCAILGHETTVTKSYQRRASTCGRRLELRRLRWKGARTWENEIKLSQGKIPNYCDYTFSTIQSNRFPTRIECMRPIQPTTASTYFLPTNPGGAVTVNPRS